MTVDEVLKRNFTRMADEYMKFAKQKDECRKCSIFQYYESVMQSEGNAKDPTFMVIGESPGREEIEQQRPFIGRAGQQLREELRKYPKVFNRQNTLISNVLACRPFKNVFPSGTEKTYHIVSKQKTVNAKEVVNFCATTWLRREVRIVKPKIIITLGSKALDLIRGDHGITAHRGTWKFVKSQLFGYSAWTFATYHPSYVIRCKNDPSRDYIPRQFSEDFKTIAETWFSTLHNDENMRQTEIEMDLIRSLA